MSIARRAAWRARGWRRLPLRVAHTLFPPAQLLQFELSLALELLLLLQHLRASGVRIGRRHLPGCVELAQLLCVQALQALQILQMQAIELLLLPEVPRGGLGLLHAQDQFIGALLAFEQGTLDIGLGVGMGDSADRHQHEPQCR